MTTTPEPGDEVIVEAVAFGSHDVIGLIGTVDTVTESGFNVRVKFTETQTVNVPATQVRPTS